MTSTFRNTLFLVIFITIALGACTNARKQEDLLLDELASMEKEAIFERAEKLFGDKKYQAARKFFSFVYDTFPNDPLGHKAALRVADTYSVKSNLESLTEARLRYPEASLRELGSYLEPPLSKSAVYHRMLRIRRIAAGL